jgi:beta-lactamase class D
LAAVGDRRTLGKNEPMRHVLTAVVILFTCQAQAAGWEENPQVGELFRSAGVKGTFVLYDVTAQTYRGHDQVRAERRFVPASTFKIPNSLIGLSVGAVKSVDEVLPYKGDPHPFIQAWAKDMGLRDAIALSNVPIYQELARRIGLERMRENVTRMEYGNREIGTTVDTFWLTGPLQISAVEQTQFLAKLAQDELPFPHEMQRSVREIVFLEQGANWRLYGKTGWENAPGQGVGWWVGWVQKDERIYAFALNMDMQNAADASKRVAVGKASLQALGLL